MPTVGKHGQNPVPPKMLLSAVSSTTASTTAPHGTPHGAPQWARLSEMLSLVMHPEIALLLVALFLFVPTQNPLCYSRLGAHESSGETHMTEVPLPKQLCMCMFFASSQLLCPCLQVSFGEANKPCLWCCRYSSAVSRFQCVLFVKDC